MVYISYAISKKQSGEHTYKVCAHWISHRSTKKKKSTLQVYDTTEQYEQWFSVAELLRPYYCSLSGN